MELIMEKNYLEKIESQHRLWLIAGLIFVFSIVDAFINILLSISDRQFLWLLALGGITISVAWWYWVMNTVSRLAYQRRREHEVLQDMIEQVRLLKETLPK